MRLGRIVAIKIPHNRNLSGKELGRFLHEARAVAQLKHPGIVSIHDVVRKENFAYIRKLGLKSVLSAPPFPSGNTG